MVVDDDNDDNDDTDPTERVSDAPASPGKGVAGEGCPELSVPESARRRFSASATILATSSGEAGVTLLFPVTSNERLTLQHKDKFTQSDHQNVKGGGIQNNHAMH